MPLLDEDKPTLVEEANSGTRGSKKGLSLWEWLKEEPGRARKGPGISYQATPRWQLVGLFIQTQVGGGQIFHSPGEG